MDAYRKLLAQSGDWRNIFDPETKWIRPKNADGTWLKDFDPENPRRSGPGRAEHGGFQEGNTWHYTFMIPFDYPDLIQSMGGGRSSFQSQSAAQRAARRAWIPAAAIVSAIEDQTPEGQVPALPEEPILFIVSHFY
jgi:putative alpha-1,2-mannosidase